MVMIDDALFCKIFSSLSVDWVMVLTHISRYILVSAEVYKAERTVHEVFLLISPILYLITIQPIIVFLEILQRNGSSGRSVGMEACGSSSFSSTALF